MTASRLTPEIDLDHLRPEQIEIICGYCYRSSSECGGQCPGMHRIILECEREAALRKLQDASGGVLIF